MSSFISKLFSSTLISRIITLSAICAFFLIFYLTLSKHQYLRFSDGAKFADIARNLIEGEGLKENFNFFNPKLFVPNTSISPVLNTPLAMPIAMAGFFKIFGISDFSVIATSGFFYVLLVLTAFLLGRKLFGNLVGFLSAVAVAVNINFLDYATSGASEILLSFEIVLAFYLIVLRKKWATVGALLILMAMYFTRPQAFIFMAAIVLFWTILKIGIKKGVSIFLIIGLAAYLFDKLILYPLSFKIPVYPIFIRGLQAILYYSPNAASSEGLRGGATIAISFLDIAKKVFYNLYNFYRLLPQIASPYLLALFIVGLFKWGKDRVENSLKMATIFMVVVTFLITALTIPLFRYLHPAIPLVYLFATTTLVWVMGQIFKKKKSIILVSSFLIFIFVVGQTLGVIFLDSRFEAKRVNKGNPPVYVVLSRILKENTDSGDVIITNLDTWGSWYGERRTIWYPIKPEQLNIREQVPFDAIYLTSYLIDDENYYMGPGWREIFENPQKIGDEFIRDNFEYKATFEVSAEETYEKQSSKAVLLVRKAL